MQRCTDYDRDLQNVVRQLAEAAKASASEKKHDVKMATIATGAAATVRNVLERSARRARLVGWITGGASVAIALVAVVVASSIARGARDMKQSYDRALIRATTESSALQAQLDNNKERWKSMHQSRIEDRSMLSNSLEKLAHAYDRLIATTSTLVAAKPQHVGGRPAEITALSINSDAKPLPVRLTKTQDITSPQDSAKDAAASKTRSAKRTTKLKSSANRRLVEAMRSQRREARGQVEELFEVYSNQSGSCVRNR